VTPKANERLTALLFAATIFLAATLLFLVQPMIARMVLPQFGGSPAVWTTCMLFFQVLLLAGYAYAHLTWRMLGWKVQVFLHLLLLLVPCAVLPISVSTAWAPEGSAEPSVLLLGLLLVSVGAPFFVVASSSPLLQAWYAALGGGTSRDPYWLYAASNAGSLAALLGYPVAVQPALTLRAQSTVWGWAYIGLVVLFGACALAVLRAPAAWGDPAPKPNSSERPPSPGQKARWTAFAFVPSSLMLGLTAHLTTDFPPVPMLWIVPLALYLLSFIVSFASRSCPPRPWIVRAIGPALLVLAYQLVNSGPPSAAEWAFLFLALFGVALGFHGELWRERPEPRQLTGFYLWIALGGALGGVFNSLVAPRVFSWVAEYPLTLALAGLLMPALRPVRWGRLATALDVLIPAGLGLAVGMWGWLSSASDALIPAGLGLAVGLRDLGQLRYALPLLACLPFSSRPLRFGLGVAAILGAWHVRMDSDGKMLHRERTFFGVLRVIESGPAKHSLIHGYILHGEQWMSADRRIRDRPLLCFYPTGPIGQVFRDLLLPRPPRPVGVVGLGAGSLASYGVAGQEFTFFEIDPAVARIARDARYFTFLRDSPAQCRVVIGDARLTLRRQPHHHYGILVVDAFSGDTVPVHLLTREALRVYLDKLAGGGVLAFHISNTYLDLEPEMAALAESESLIVRVCMDDQLRPDELLLGKKPSRWAVMARRTGDLGPLMRDPRWRSPAARPGQTAWTDDFSNPLELIVWP
jgi:hypothetical protein